MDAAWRRRLLIGAQLTRGTPIGCRKSREHPSLFCPSGERKLSFSKLTTLKTPKRLPLLLFHLAYLCWLNFSSTVVLGVQHRPDLGSPPGLNRYIFSPSPNPCLLVPVPFNNAVPVFYIALLCLPSSTSCVRYPCFPCSLTPIQSMLLTPSPWPRLCGQPAIMFQSSSITIVTIICHHATVTIIFQPKEDEDQAKTQR